MHDKVPILITPGEPLGIGPDIVVKSLAKLKYSYKIIADPQILIERAQQLKIKINEKKLLENSIPILNNSPRYVLDCLDIAVKLCLQKKACALVTGPVNKAMVCERGFDFIGHTHYLAKKSKTKDKDVLMFFENPQFKLALVTDHLPLSKVPKNITQKRLEKVIILLQENLQKNYKIKSPRIAVCGLNPHAGENGYLGFEEIKIIKPVIKKFQQLGYKIFGPTSADSLFNENNLKQYDAVIAMYHDQGLCVLKHRHFGNSVNITLGLPFLRTSVDHGTACELAGTGKADESNFMYVFSRTVALVKENWG